MESTAAQRTPQMWTLLNPSEREREVGEWKERCPEEYQDNEEWRARYYEAKARERGGGSAAVAASA